MLCNRVKTAVQSSVIDVTDQNHFQFHLHFFLCLLLSKRAINTVIIGNYHRLYIANSVGSGICPLVLGFISPEFVNKSYSTIWQSVPIFEQKKIETLEHFDWLWTVL